MVVLKALNLSEFNSLQDHPYSTRIQAIKKMYPALSQLRSEFSIQGAVYSNRCDPCLMLILLMPIKVLTMA